MSRQYYGVEDLALTAAQRQTLVTVLKSIGDNNSRPEWRNHQKVRLDNKAVIFEGRFHDEDWTVDNVKTKLANIFNISPAIITSNVTQTPYGPAVTFGAGGTDRIRMIAFGGLLATWDESHNAVTAYLLANSAQWEEVLG